MALCPNMSAENWNFLKLLKTMIVGALWVRLGLLSISQKLLKCGFGSQKTAKSTLKRSYLSSRFFESGLHIAKAFRGLIFFDGDFWNRSET